MSCEQSSNHANKTVTQSFKGTWSPLHSAIWGGDDLGNVRLLLDEGADIAQTSDHHQSTHTTVLHNAACNGNTDLLKLLFDYGAEVLLESKCGPGEEGRRSGHTALQIAAKRGHHDVAHLLLDRGAHYDFFSAVCLGDMGRVQILIDAQPDVVASRDDYNTTPLHWAAEQDQEEASNFLLDQGIDVDAGDDFGETPLLVASVRAAKENDGKSLAAHLISSGAKMDVFTASAFGDRDRLEQMLNGAPQLTLQRHVCRILGRPSENGDLFVPARCEPRLQ